MNRLTPEDNAYMESLIEGAVQERKGVQVRFGDGGITDIDEIVTGQDAQVHLERMDTAQWCLIIETPSSRSQFSIHKKGKEVVVTTVCVDMTGGYAARGVKGG